MALPKFQSADPVRSKDFGLLQTTWASQIDPIVVRPQNRSNILPQIAIKSGTNVINHLLQRQMQGWSIVDIDAAATIYRSQPFNDLTLTLTSNANCNILLEVF